MSPSITCSLLYMHCSLISVMKNEKKRQMMFSLYCFLAVQWMVERGIYQCKELCIKKNFSWFYSKSLPICSAGMMFFSYMIEDKGSSGLSYVEFLVHVHRQIQVKMSSWYHTLHLPVWFTSFNHPPPKAQYRYSTKCQILARYTHSPITLPRKLHWLLLLGVHKV